MTTTTPYSTNKIVALLFFICTAIMASVFVYYMSHKQPAESTPLISSDDGIIFPSARELKPFELMTTEGNAFTEKNLRGHWTLLFFGFTHCSSICPTTLTLFKNSYDQLHKAYPNLQIVFISLDPERDTRARLSSYTQGYNPAFISVSGKIQELRKLQSQLGVYSSNDASSQNNYQIQHTASIMLINPHGEWAGLYKYGMTPTHFTQVVADSMQAINRNNTNFAHTES